MSNEDYRHQHVESLVEMLRIRSVQQRDKAAYFFLDAEHGQDRPLTHGELDRQARTIGGWLQSRDLAGERALLLFPAGPEYIASFFGCLYANVVAVPAYPPRLNRSAERLKAIVRDSSARVALSTRVVFNQAQRLFDQAPELRSLEWLLIEEVADDLASVWRPPVLTGDELAFLQYTSGSTSDPRGVMLTHRNLLHNLEAIRQGFEHTQESRGVIWLPPYHDMGLIGGILQPLYAGFPSLLMPPVTFVTEPYRWLQAISRFRGTTSGGPNFAYDLCVQKITPEQRTTLDLSTWQVAFTGAEPIRAVTIDRFVEAFAPYGFRREAFYACYGLAEATLMVSGGPKSVAPRTLTICKATLEKNQVQTEVSENTETWVLVGCGKGLADQCLVIVDPETLKPAAPGTVGEVCVAGPSIARGYWNQPQQSRQTFQVDLPATAGDPFLRTGDLGFFHEGELFITGRLKDLLIIRGRNLYPQDIERTVEQCDPTLLPAGCAAFAVPHAAGDPLVIVAEVNQRRSLDAAALMSTIRQAVAAEFEVAVHAIVLLKKGGLARTSSSKLRRHTCREAFLAQTLETVAEWHAAQECPPLLAGLSRPQLLAVAPAERSRHLLAILQQELARRLGLIPPQVPPDLPLTQLGLDSLTAMELKNRLETQLGVAIPVMEFLQGLSLAQLVERVLTDLEAPATSTRNLDQLVRQLHQLSDEEVRRLLERDVVST